MVSDYQENHNNMGPTQPVSQQIHADKYRMVGESFEESMSRVAAALSDSDAHRTALKDILQGQRFLPGGRVQSAMGSTRAVTAYNCFVAPTIDDSMKGILDTAGIAAQTMRLGGGIGYDFSTLRPRGDVIRSLDSHSSGPVSFMGIFDSVCHTISSAGHRRGAQMAVLRVDHPDIEEFIRAKRDGHSLTAFNISVGVDDAFMSAVRAGRPYFLRFDGRVHKEVDARSLWDEIMRSTWDWAEPGVVFLDTINRMNNLFYCERIAATNPCGEQPLPPNGACLLGSFNLVKYIDPAGKEFDHQRFIRDIHHVVRGMDNVIDRSRYPLTAQQDEAESKRRMGLGVTGVANALEALGYSYGSLEFRNTLARILGQLRATAYSASVRLAEEKGPFPLYDDVYTGGEFVKTLPGYVREEILRYGIRNSHLLSIAPTGTISLSADNVSSGIEPVYQYQYDRVIQTPDGPQITQVEDYGYREFGTLGKRADHCTVDEHLGVMLTAQRYVDSAVSKTCNVGTGVTWDEFLSIYDRAHAGGAKGCTTFRASGKRAGIFKTDDDAPPEAACRIDPDTGRRDCD